MVSAPPARSWIGMVSRKHVLRSVAGGFAMLNHGRRAPLLRRTPGAWLICHSPRETTAGAPLQAFAALGEVAPGALTKLAMAPGRVGFRRAVARRDATETPIAGLSGRLEFTRGNWGMLARRGLFGISAADFGAIRAAMLER